MRMTPERLQEIRARCEAATPGPWETGDRFPPDDDSDRDWHCIHSRATSSRITGNYDYEEGGVCSTKEDGEFIAAARQDVPDLLAYIAELEAELAHAVMCMDRACPRCNARVKEDGCR